MQTNISHKMSTQEKRKILIQEKVIGRKASKLVNTYLKEKIRQRLQTNNRTNQYQSAKKTAPILKATKSNPAVGKHRLLGLNLKSNQYAFIQHFGANTTRHAHLVTQKNGTTFQRKAHPFLLPKTSIFKDMYQKSGAIQYLEKELSKTRIEATIIQLKKHIPPSK